jgi:DNA polymerase-3 subunit epsilon
MQYVIVDIETTGGGPKTSRITEIAMYKHDGERVLDELISLIDPEMRIPEFIVRLTGINDRMVQGQPKFFEIAKDIIEFSEGCVFVAHNVGFDYGILRHEFKRLGYDYRRPHLCTVRLARHVLPGKESYSLGKLTRSLGIPLNGRHRAGGDALATATLFELLHREDHLAIGGYIKEELNPKILHPNLDREALDELPEKTGIYLLYNDTNQLIYIGKSKSIKTRIEQHLRNSSTKKGLVMGKEIARIDFELTGSELLALIQESILVKKHRPPYNQKLKKTRFPFGLYRYEDAHGYIRFTIDRVSRFQTIPLASFTTKQEGARFLTRKTEEFELCQKLTELYPTQHACFHYSIKKCRGACIQEESTENYNERALAFISRLELTTESMYIVDKGRQKNEKSLILIKNGSFAGFGYAPFHFNGLAPKDWDEFIDYIQEDRDIRLLVWSHLRKSEKLNLVPL